MSRPIGSERKTGSIGGLAARAGIAIVILGLSLRLVFFLAVHPWSPAVESDIILQRDAAGYHQIATTMLATGRFASTPAGPPNALRTPGYPALVCAVYRIMGPHPMWVLVLQCVLDALAGLALARAVGQLFRDARAGLAAGVLYASDPFLILHCNTLLSDVMFVWMMVVIVAQLPSLLLPSDRGSRSRALVGLGLAMGVATLVRPIGQLLPGLAILLLASVPDLRDRKLLPAAVLGLALSLALPGLWVARNARTFGVAELSTSGAYNLLVLNAVPLEQLRTGLSAEVLVPRLLSEADSMASRDGVASDDPNPFRVSRYWRATALAHLRRDPVGFARVTVTGAIQLFASIGSSGFGTQLGEPIQAVELRSDRSPLDHIRDFARSKGWRGMIVALFVLPVLLVTYFGACIGFWELVRLGRMPTALILLAFVAYFVLLSAADGSSRFKLPMLPFYLPLSAVGIVWALRKRIGRAVGLAPH